MRPIHPYVEILQTRFGGVLSKGRHSPADGKANVLEVASLARGLIWTNEPEIVGLPDLQPLNDGPWPSAKARTKALVPVVLALWDWNVWDGVRRQRWARRVVEREAARCATGRHQVGIGGSKGGGVEGGAGSGLGSDAGRSGGASRGEDDRGM